MELPVPHGQSLSISVTGSKRSIRNVFSELLAIWPLQEADSAVGVPVPRDEASSRGAGDTAQTLRPNDRSLNYQNTPRVPQASPGPPHTASPACACPAPRPRLGFRPAQRLRQAPPSRRPRAWLLVPDTYTHIHTHGKTPPPRQALTTHRTP